MKLFILTLLIFSSCLEAKNKDYETISAIKAHIFYTETGNISKNILGIEDFVLWNTIIGEGDAKGPSENVLVVIEVTKPKNQKELKAKEMEVSISSKNKTLIETKRKIGFSSTNKFNVPVLVADVGCQTLTIKVSLIGSKSTPIVETIDFQCGE